MSSAEFYVVDRMEGSVAVVVTDDGRSFDVPQRLLPKGSREGSVLRVTLRHGTPDWPHAIVDEEEQARRLRDARKTLDRMKKSDPGGDIEL
jgi:hypothetical protein